VVAPKTREDIVRGVTPAAKVYNRRPSFAPWDDMEVGDAIPVAPEDFKAARNSTYQHNFAAKNTELAEDYFAKPEDKKPPKYWYCGKGEDGNYYIWRMR